MEYNGIVIIRSSSLIAVFGWAALTLVGNNLQMVPVVDRRMHGNHYLINNYNIGNFETCLSYKSLF